MQSLSRVRLFVTLWTAARQAPLSITNSRSLLKLMSIESVMPSTHLTLCRPLLLLPLYTLYLSVNAYGEGNGTPLPYSCLENPMDGGAWWAAVHGVTKSQIRLSSQTSLSLFTFMHWRRQWQPTPVFLPGESQGRGSLVGGRLWGRTESDTTEAT